MKEQNPQPHKFSIIICTYNPDDRILGRCLNAVNSLLNNELDMEVIVVDNNSSESVANREYVRAFLNNSNKAYILEEKKQGLVYARIAGVAAASGDILVFLDDDNEVALDYLHELNKLLLKYPNVGAWGPGKVSVDFLDGTGQFSAGEIARMFQLRNSTVIEYAMVRNWQDCYPFGTGLSIRKDIAQYYAEEIQSKNYTLTGRSGGRMTSGEDSQMILSGILKGYAAGNSPGLKINHMITGSKVKVDYIKRLAFGASSCYYQFHVEVFPEYIKRIEFQKLSFNYKYYLKKSYKFYRLKAKNKTMAIVKMIEELGIIYSLAIARKQPVPKYLERLLKKIGC